MTVGRGSGSGDVPRGKDPRPGGPVCLGELLVSKETTLEELKLQVMTLPKMAEVPIPTQVSLPGEQLAMAKYFPERLAIKSSSVSDIFF